MGPGRRHRPARRPVQAGRPRPRRFLRVLDQVLALSEVRQQAVHDPHGSDDHPAGGQSRSCQGGGARSGQVPDRRRHADRMGQGDDQARRRQGHPLGHHDDRVGGAADDHLEHRRGPDGLQARQRRLQDRGAESRGRQAGHAMGARPLRQMEGLDPRCDQPLQGLRHRPGLDLLDRPLDLERLCPAEAQLPQLCLSQDRQHPPHLSRGRRDGALCAEGHRPLRGLNAGGEVALRQQPPLDDQGPRRLAPDLDPEQSPVQDRGSALGSARRFRRGRLLCDAEPGRPRPGGTGFRALCRR